MENFEIVGAILFWIGLLGIYIGRKKKVQGIWGWVLAIPLLLSILIFSAGTDLGKSVIEEFEQLI